MEKRWQILLHVVIWFMFLIIPTFIYLSITIEIPKSIEVYNITTYVSALLSFYIGYLFVTPKIAEPTKTWYRVVWIVGIILIIFSFRLIVVWFVDWLFDQELRKYQHFKWFMMAGELLNNSLILAVGFLVRISIKWFKDQRMQSEIKLQKQNQELAFLKAQVNPHFFFNTINNIYSLVYKKSDDAPAALLKLSEIMRYMLYEAKSDLVPVEKELLHLESYLELERLRFKDATFIEFGISGYPEGWQVPPMLLLSFVENAFKHGKRRVKNPGIEIDLQMDSEKLTFRIINYIKDERSTESEGIGMQNVKRRLELLYPGCHELQITQVGERFKVLLTLSCRPQIP